MQQLDQHFDSLNRTLTHPRGRDHWVPDVDPNLIAIVQHQLAEVVMHLLSTAVKEGWNEGVPEGLLDGPKMVFDV